MRITEWRGPQVKARVNKAAMLGIDVVTHAAAQDAAQSHWYTRRTGRLEANTLNEAAKPETGDRMTGRFGTANSPGGFYGFFLERRHPFLRPAADRHFPLLATVIRRFL